MVLNVMKRKQLESGAASPLAGEFITEAEIASLLHVNSRTLADWREKRALPHVKITPKHVLYKRADIDAWLAQRTVTVAA